MYLLIAFMAVPIIEIALFIQVGGVIGLWPTLLIVIATAIAGSWLMRTQGALAMSQVRTALSQQQNPSEPIAHGAMILVAGVLLLTPGFFTDAVGLALLTPGVRRVVFNFARKHVNVQMVQPGGPASRGPAQGDVIEGEYHEVDPANVDDAPRPR